MHESARAFHPLVRLARVTQTQNLSAKTPPGWLALRCAGRSAFGKAITQHSFHKVESEKDAKISGIPAAAIALIAAGKLSATVAARYNLSAIKDAVAHLEWGGKPPPGARQM